MRESGLPFFPDARLRVIRWIVLGLALGPWMRNASAACGDTAYLKIVGQSGDAADEVSASISGKINCRITGFSLAICTDPAVLAFQDVAPGPILVAHTGQADLAFGSFSSDADGCFGLYAVFDLTPPIDFAPISLGQEVLLAAVRYKVKPGARPGTTPLHFADMTFGDPYPVACIYTLEPGLAPVTPALIDGTAMIGHTNVDFLRGDANGDGNDDIGDAVLILAYIFQGAAVAGCVDSADVNDDGMVDISDPIYLLYYMFLGGTRPPEPFTTPGPDPTPDALGCS